MHCGRPRPRGMAGRAVVFRIEPPVASRPLKASIDPSLRSADAYGPASSFGPARFACVRFAHRGGRCRVQPSLLTPSPFWMLSPRQKT